MATVSPAAAVVSARRWRCLLMAVAAMSVAAMSVASVGLAGTMDPVESSPPGTGIVERPAFGRHIVPLFTKAGCNAGACHGSFQGRGGFRLSLLGYDPAADYEQVALALRGRRINVASPRQSLLWRKATGMVPHGGGRRLAEDSEAAQLLERYLAQGAPRDVTGTPAVVGLRIDPASPVCQPGETWAVRAWARWSDGQEEEVTRWALFDARDEALCRVSRTGEVGALAPGKAAVMVRYQGLAVAADITVRYPAAVSLAGWEPRNFIDQLIRDEWQRIGVTPAPLADDSTFIRRVYGDLIGTLPSPSETRRFLADSAPDKRDRLIDELLRHPAYADYWSLKWGDLLRVHRRYVGDKGLATFSDWLKQQLRDNRPVSALAEDLLTARGNAYQSGPVSFYFVDARPEELAETTAQVFLGVRLQCARCHHHPLEVWSQEDYYGLASFFTRLDTKELGGTGRFGGLRLLRTTTEVPEARRLPVPAVAKLLGGPVASVPPGEDIRRALANWIVDRDNRFFARNFANRYWSYLFGVGLVEPVDDLRDSNPASIPTLLDALARDFAAHGYDARELLRTICRSRTYQSAARLAPLTDRDGRLFTQRIPRQLPAEVLLDALNQIAGTSESFTGMPSGTRAIQLPDPAIASSFLADFGRPPRNSPCECARPSQPNLAQALQLLNSEMVQAKLAAPTGTLAGWEQSGRPVGECIEELYLACFSRFPTEDERHIAERAVAAAGNRREGLEDLLWSLWNTAEFVFSH